MSTVKEWDLISIFKAEDNVKVEIFKAPNGSMVVETEDSTNQLDFKPAKRVKGERTQVVGKKSKSNYPNGIGPTKRLLQLVLERKLTKQDIQSSTLRNELIEKLRAEGYGKNGAFYPASYWDAVKKEMKWKM